MEVNGVTTDYKKVSELMKSFFNEFDCNKIQQVNSFIKTWNEIVGEKIASHSAVIDVDRGNVIIEVDHPGWSQQILFKKKQILYGLAQNYPDLKIKNLVMRIVTECKTPYVKQIEPIGEGIPRQEEVLSETNESKDMDEELKKVLEKLKISIKKGKPV